MSMVMFFFSKRRGEVWSERLLNEKICISGNGPSHIQTLHFYLPISGYLSQVGTFSGPEGFLLREA